MMSQPRIKKLLLALISIFLLMRPFNLIEAQALNPGEVVINEVMWMGSSISTADEWLELRNMSNHDIDISGFKIKGAGESGKELIIPAGKTISALGYFLISNNSKDYKFSKGPSVLNIEPDWVINDLSLSNSNLKIELFDPNNILIDQAGNGQMPFAGKNTSNEKASMERNNQPSDGGKKENWHTASSSINFDPGSIEKGTPKAENSPPAQNPSSDSQNSSTAPNISLPQLDPEGEDIIALSTIKEAKQQPKETEVFIEGVVTAAPGQLSTHYFYIQDQTAGISVYFSKELPSLSIGQQVGVFGKISEAYNEKRIKISQSDDIAILEQGKEPQPLALKTGQVNEAYEGILAKVKGAVVDPGGNLFYLDDGSGKIKIYIKSETKIAKPRLKAGQSLEITGIVSQYKDAYRILPRKSDDLKTPDGKVLATTETAGEAAKEAKDNEDGEGIEEEEEIEDTSSGEEENQKVLGTEAKKSQLPPWSIVPILAGLGILGYLINDYQNQKRTGNSKIWSKVRPVFERWRNYWTLRRAGKR